MVTHVTNDLANDEKGSALELPVEVLVFVAAEAAVPAVPTDTKENRNCKDDCPLVLHVCSICQQYLPPLQPGTDDDVSISMSCDDTSVRTTSIELLPAPIKTAAVTTNDTTTTVGNTNCGVRLELVPQHQTCWDCFVCLGVYSHTTNINSSSSSSNNKTDGDTTQKDALAALLVETVHQASSPYNTPTNTDYVNRYSRHKSIPTVVLPGDIVYRLLLLQSLLMLLPRQQISAVKNTATAISATPSLSFDIDNTHQLLLQDYVNELKLHTKQMIQKCCMTLDNNNNALDYYSIEYPPCIHEEELGYLTFHAIIIPTPTLVHRPMDWIQQYQRTTMTNQSRNRKRTRKERMMKQNSVINDTDTVRHNNNNGDDIDSKTTTTAAYQELSQGGDPRINFERRFLAQQSGGNDHIRHGRRNITSTSSSSSSSSSGCDCIWSINHAMDQLSEMKKFITSLLLPALVVSETGRETNKLFEHIKHLMIPTSPISQPITTTNQYASNRDRLSSSSSSSSVLLSCYATVWRRPFYIRGIYTKIYRTISQTPFFVIDDVVVVVDTCESGDCDNTTSMAVTFENVNPGKVTIKKRRRRLGTTSVEEVITPYIVQATNGIATHNNTAITTDSCVHNGNSGMGQVVYGMAKFHASGREDMNVRMLLPVGYNYKQDWADTTTTANSKDDGSEPTMKRPKITGRPFVYEIYDAIRLPRIHDLFNIVISMNQIPPLTPSITPSSRLKSINNIREQRRSYGCNPLGVDVSHDISFVPSSSYKRLQEETENKIKYYECHCWSEQKIDDIIQSHHHQQQQQQQEQQRRSKSDIEPPQQNEKILNVEDATTSVENTMNDLLFGHLNFPIEIQQRTPIRVLHRRTNMIRPRYIYSCRIQLLPAIANDDCQKSSNDHDPNINNFAVYDKNIDNSSCHPLSLCKNHDDMNHPTLMIPHQSYQQHNFIVHLSTSAGTYVKEFIHGDLGRTIPNLSAIFGHDCRTDILELDCTGIQS